MTNLVKAGVYMPSDARWEVCLGYHVRVRLTHQREEGSRNTHSFSRLRIPPKRMNLIASEWCQHSQWMKVLFWADEWQRNFKRKAPLWSAQGPNNLRERSSSHPRTWTPKTTWSYSIFLLSTCRAAIIGLKLHTSWGMLAPRIAISMTRKKLIAKASKTCLISQWIRDVAIDYN